MRVNFGVQNMAKYILFMATIPITVYTFVGFEYIESEQLQDLRRDYQKFQGIYDMI